MHQLLAFKTVSLPESYQYKVLFFDPAAIYARISILPQARHQSSQNIGMRLMFPKRADKICACGCGKPLTGKRSKWATDDCVRFAVDVYQIIYGQRDVIKYYLKKYNGYQCQCGRVRKMKIDHIVPVKHGGGGCWLSNYQFLCHKCHVEKTKTDFGWKSATK